MIVFTPLKTNDKLELMSNHPTEHEVNILEL